MALSFVLGPRVFFKIERIRPRVFLFHTFSHPLDWSFGPSQLIDLQLIFQQRNRASGYPHHLFPSANSSTPHLQFSVLAYLALVRLLKAVSMWIDARSLCQQSMRSALFTTVIIIKFLRTQGR